MVEEKRWRSKDAELIRSKSLILIMPKKETYCPSLWGGVFIDPKGDVYSCCHKKPSVIGNIHEQKLEDIYDNSIIRQLRQNSLDGQLDCYQQCTLLDKEKEKKSKVPKSKTFNYHTDLRRMKIEFGELCNISCVMCWQDHKNKTVLDHKTLIKNVDLTPFESIDIQGGEPLAIYDARAFYEYVVSQNKRPLFMTNGLLIDDVWAEKIALYSSFVYVSLNAATRKIHEMVNKGSKWDSVMRNIQRLRKARERQRTVLKIIGHMTIIAGNIHEIPLFIKNFRGFGVDKIDFGYDKKVPGYLNDHPLLKVFLKRQIDKVFKISKNSLSVDSKMLKRLGLI